MNNVSLFSFQRFISSGPMTHICINTLLGAKPMPLSILVYDQSSPQKLWNSNQILKYFFKKPAAKIRGRDVKTILYIGINFLDAYFLWLEKLYVHNYPFQTFSLYNFWCPTKWSAEGTDLTIQFRGWMDNLVFPWHQIAPSCGQSAR